MRTRLVGAVVVAGLALASWRVAPQLRVDPRARFLRSELATVLDEPLTAFVTGDRDRLPLPSCLDRALPPGARDELDELLRLFATARAGQDTKEQRERLWGLHEALFFELRDAKIPLLLDMSLAPPPRLASFYVERRERVSLGKTAAVVTWVRHLGGVARVGRSPWWRSDVQSFLAPLDPEHEPGDLPLKVLVRLEIAYIEDERPREELFYVLEQRGYIAAGLASLARDADLRPGLERLVGASRIEPEGPGDRLFGAALPLLLAELGLRDAAELATLPAARVREAATRAYTKAMGRPPLPLVRTPLP